MSIIKDSYVVLKDGTVMYPRKGETWTEFMKRVNEAAAEYDFDSDDLD